jgi:uncharacterized repeat protein (TIGR01451 family)
LELRCAHAFPALILALAALLAAPAASAALNVATELTPDPVRGGETLHLRITATNDGVSDVSNVTVTTVMPVGLASLSELHTDGDCISTTCDPGETVTWTLGTLPAGKGVTVTISPRVLGGASTPPDGTVIAFTANVLESAVVQDSDAVSAVVEAAPALELRVSEDVDPAQADGFVTYTLDFGHREVSLVDANGELTLDLPSAAAFVSASDGGSHSAGTVTWSLGSLAPGAGDRVQATAQFAGGTGAGTVHVAEATLTDLDDTVREARTRAVTRVEAAAPLELELELTPQEPRPGETLHARLTVSNRDTVDRTGVELLLRYPNDLASVSELRTTGDCLSTTCDPGEEMVFTLGTLPAGTGQTVSLPPLLLGGVNAAPAGTLIELEAHARDDDDAFVESSESVRVSDAPALELRLSEHRDPAQAGGLLTYTVDLGHRETSVADASGTLTLVLPAETSFVSASDGGTHSAGTVTWILGTLPPGTGDRVHATVSVDGGTAAGVALVADAALTDALDTTRKARARAVTRVEAAPPLAFELELTPQEPRPGQTLHFRLTLTNHDTVDHTGVEAVLRYPDDLAATSEARTEGDCPSTTCDPGEFMVFSFGTLPAGTGRTVSMPPLLLGGASTSPEGTLIEFDAHVSDDDGIFIEQNASVRVRDDPTFELRIAEDADPAEAGDFVTWALDFGHRETSVADADAALTLALPSGVSFVSASDGGSESGGTVTWALGTLEPGAGGQVRATAQVSGGTALGALLNADATITNTLDPLREARARAVTRVQAAPPLELALELTPQSVRPGERADLGITVTNTDTVALTGVVVELRYPDDLASISEFHTQGDCASTTCDPDEIVTFTAGTLAPGTGRTFAMPSALLSGVASSPEGTLIEYEAHAFEDGGGFVEAARSVLVQDEPALELRIEESVDPVLPGDYLVYRIVYGHRDTSLSDADGKLRFELPDGVNFGTSTGGGTLTSGGVEWSLGSIAPGTVGVVEVAVEVPAGIAAGTSLVADARFDDLGDPDREARARCVTVVEPTAPLGFATTVAPRATNGGGTVDVAATLTNQSGGAAADVVVTLQMPDDIKSTSEAATNADCPSTTCDEPELAELIVGPLADTAEVTLDMPLTLLSGVSTPPTGTLVSLRTFGEATTPERQTNGRVTFAVADAHPVCGNGIVDMLEPCDSALAPPYLSLCSETCELSDFRPLFAEPEAEGGTVTLTVDGITVVVPTSPGQDPDDILAALAAAINADPALAALGTTASVEFPRLVTTGRIEEYVVSDNGLIGVRLVPALSPALQGLAWGLVCAIGLAATRRRRHRSRG